LVARNGEIREQPGAKLQLFQARPVQKMLSPKLR
jgi:hypothetical protein